jgi:hypothetical protein
LIRFEGLTPAERTKAKNQRGNKNNFGKTKQYAKQEKNLNW